MTRMPMKWTRIRARKSLGKVFRSRLGITLVAALTCIASGTISPWLTAQEGDPETGDSLAGNYFWEVKVDEDDGHVERVFRYRYDESKKLVNDGPQLWFNENGTIRSQYLMEDHRFIGMYRSWHDNGEPQEVCSYDENGKRSGQMLVWDRRGGLVEESWYKDGLRDGLTKNYQDGVLRCETPYLQGKMHGIQTMYWPDSPVVEQEQEYQDGAREGVFRRYRRDGSIEHESVVRDGSLEMERKYWEDGISVRSLFETNEIAPDCKYGKMVYYDRKGRPTFESQSVNGSPEGMWKYYIDGILVRRVEYQNGREKMEERFSEGVITMRRIKTCDGIDSRKVEEDFDQGELVERRTYVNGELKSTELFGSRAKNEED